MRRTRHLVPQSPAGATPIVELNTTPLIDVMLVLLVMVLLSIPLLNHKVSADLPQGPGTGNPQVHRLALDAAGRLSWDGTPLAVADLPARLAGVRADPDQLLHIRADAETPYDAFDKTLAAVKRARIENIGIIDNDRFAVFDRH